jgi:hypothetical protein
LRYTVTQLHIIQTAQSNIIPREFWRPLAKYHAIFKHFYNKYRTVREITAGSRQAPVLPTTAPFPILNNIFTSVFVHAVPRISRPVPAVPLNKGVKAGVKLEMYVIPQFVQVKFVEVHTSPPFFCMV